jgi:hypothetical protein
VLCIPYITHTRVFCRDLNLTEMACHHGTQRTYKDVLVSTSCNLLLLLRQSCPLALDPPACTQYVLRMHFAPLLMLLFPYCAPLSP